MAAHAIGHQRESRGTALSRMVKAALGGHDVSAVKVMLQSIADSLASHGCALWQVNPEFLDLSSASRRTLPADTRLFVLADSYPRSVVCAFHDLPLSSATGTAVREGRVNIVDVLRDPRVDKKNPFINRMGIRSLCSVGVEVEKGIPGALTVYRMEPGGFTDTEMDLLALLADHIPVLYPSIQDLASGRLRVAVNQELDRAHDDSSSPDSQTLNRVCELVQESFQCIEVSVYLRGALTGAEELDLKATTCPQLIRKSKYRLGEQGLTPWVYSNCQPINVFDVLSMDQTQFPGLEWQDHVGVKQAISKVLGLKEDEMFPPVSFVAVPIVADGRSLGVIRCCTIPAGPYYFSKNELELLQTVADKIGQYVRTRFAREALHQELLAWRDFENQLRDLNSLAHRELTTPNSKYRSIVRSAVGIAKRAWPVADTIGISVVDHDGQGKTIRVGDGDISALDEFRANMSTMLNGQERAVVWQQSSTADSMMQGFHNAIIAPMVAEGECLGHLIVACKSVETVPDRALVMLEFLGQQLALYYLLSRSISRQTQIYTDFLHQIRSPIFLANKTARAVKGRGADFNLQTTRGLLSKGQQVVRNLSAFAKLAGGETIKPALEAARAREVVKLLEEAAHSNRFLYSDRNIRFSVDRKSFDPVFEFVVDWDLLDQAVGNVLDNAGKYSDRDSEVRIYCEARPDQRTAIVFRNKGIPLNQEQCRRAVERGWRGEAAKRRSSEGTGIGLWIASKFMEAMKGGLSIVPADDDRMISIELILRDPSRNR